MRKNKNNDRDADKTPFNFRISTGMLAELQKRKARSGASLTWMIEQAIRAWLDRKAA